MLRHIARLFRSAHEGQSASKISPLIFDPHFSNARHRVMILADGAGATQRISFDLPLMSRRKTGEVALALYDESAISAPQDMTALLSSVNPTILVASRYGGVGSKELVDYCRGADIPLVSHFDDDLFDVPLSLGKAKFDRYHDPRRQQSMRTLCEGSNLLYLSTKELKRRFERYGFKSEAIEGEIYCPASNDVKRELSDKCLFGYMGTAGHAEDLAQMIPAIEQVLDRLPEARFETFGSIKMPTEIARKYGDRIRSIPPTADYNSFLARMRALDWKVGLAPLVRNPFNDCKANTKFIEYVCAGVLPVLPEGPVYAGICAVTGLPQHGNEAWPERIIRLLSMPQSEATALLQHVQDKTAEFYSLARLESQVVKVLQLHV
ncbi:hypothetical protein ABID08_006146 [Rhizobium binae]|uniref:Glycosyltransferase n=1 Tax=Rhizobium binae TaxID=1138190 RepID=A0ABV2MT88_9HYPH|nr:glycosyltransferase family 4 protein [Rhizobium binae]MBX4994138.1 hypothetical protein [Rhizobium binae]NKL51771.1 hypothetical protein [Rhizobium leguminosarum bv. viciae]QSY82999.1 hypothetical protein J2J99_04035 [Rhizobium binae]